MDFRLILVLAPIVLSALFTVFWLTRWEVVNWSNSAIPGFPSIDNLKAWEDTAITSTGEKTAYPVFTVRTLAVNALGIPTVFFLGSIFAMQFLRQ